MMDKNRWWPLPFEWLFLVLGLIFGLWIVFLNPPWHANDEDRHFLHAYFISEGQIVAEVNEEMKMIGGELPENLYTTVRNYQGIPFQQGVKINKIQMEQTFDIPLNESNKQFYHDHSYMYNPVPFLPHAAGIAIGGVFDDRPVALGWAGRIGGLIFYLIIIFLAIKVTPVFKSVFFLLGLMPMMLYQGTAISHDMMSNSMTILFIALVLRYTFGDIKKLEWRDYLILAVVLIVHRFAKDGYYLIPFLLFIIPPKKFGELKQAIPIMAGIFIFCLLLYKLPDMLWGPFMSQMRLPEKPKLMTDFKKSLPMAMDEIFADPVGFMGILINNLSAQKHEWFGGIVGRFGYSYSLMPNWFALFYGLLLIFAAFFDSKRQYSLSAYQKALIFVIGFGSFFAIIVGGYLAMTPVGAEMIFGMQGRYFLPAVPIMLLFLYNNQFDYKGWHKWNSIILAAVAIVALLYTTSFMDEAFYQ